MTLKSGKSAIVTIDDVARLPRPRQFPGTFSVPNRYAKHMMVVADLAQGDPGAIEDALQAAWLLQLSAS